MSNEKPKTAFDILLSNKTYSKNIMFTSDRPSNSDRLRLFSFYSLYSDLNLPILYLDTETSLENDNEPKNIG